MRDLLYQLVDSRRTKRLLSGAPVDLLVVIGFATLAVAILEVASATSTIVRTAIGLPLLFLAPGYVIVAMLFPRSSPPRPVEAGFLCQTRSVSNLERGALSFGLSVAVVPFLGLGIALTSWGFTDTVVLRTVVAFVVLGALLAGVRRSRVPPSDRYGLRPRRLLRSARAALIADSRVHTAVNLLLVVSVLIALSTVGYALAAPQNGESYSTLSVLTESDDGDLVASDYPEEFTAGESQELAVAVDNHEGERTQYELLIVVDRVTDDGATVVEREELDSLEVTLEDGEHWSHDHEIAPEMTGEDLRVGYLLFEGEAPEDPDLEDSTESVYFWTDVEA